MLTNHIAQSFETKIALINFLLLSDSRNGVGPCAFENSRGDGPVRIHRDVPPSLLVKSWNGRIIDSGFFHQPFWARHSCYAKPHAHFLPLFFFVARVALALITRAQNEFSKTRSSKH